MFFTDRDKQIYTPTGSTAKFDPLAVNNKLTVYSLGTLNDLLADHNAFGEEKDKLDAEDADSPAIPSLKKAVADAAVRTATADLKLAHIARQAFGLPPFPDCLDANALEILFDFLGWLEGKDAPGVTRQQSPSLSDSMDPSTTNSSSLST
jgi:hypothetical protein